MLKSPTVYGTILPAKRGQSILSVEITCPFCGKRHTHGVSQQMAAPGVTIGCHMSHCSDPHISQRYTVVIQPLRIAKDDVDNQAPAPT